MKLLIADNEVSRLRNLRSILTSLGHKSADIDSVEDGEAALVKLKKKRFNIVFCSIELPRLDGLGLLKSIRENSRLKNLPVVMYSSDIDRDGVVHAVEKGADGFLVHPCSVSDVEDVLKSAVDKRGRLK